MSPGGVLLLRQGKQFPGESLPRWTLELIGRQDGAPLWEERGADPWRGEPGIAQGAADAQKLGSARSLAEAIAARVGLEGFVLPAYEDPWQHLREEAALPIDVDPLAADLRDPEERRRLARVLDRGLGAEAGYVLPLKFVEGAFRSERWSFRPGRLYLLPGDQQEALTINSYAKIINRTLAHLYRAGKFRVAHVDEAFKTYDTTRTTTLAGQPGPVPVAVAEVCRLTWMCAPAPIGPNIHANEAGYGVIAGAFARAFAAKR